jgi:formate/nitrite transporter FocA (FNT family)
MERRLRISGVLVVLGLLIEAFSLLWVHALAFLIFAIVGGLFIGLGILTYLYSLVSMPQTPPGNAN